MRVVRGRQRYTLLMSAKSAHGTAHVSVTSHVQMFRGPQDDENLKIYRNTVAVTDSMAAAVAVLKSKENISPSEFVRMAEQGLLSLPFHRNLRFVSLLIHRCAKHYVR